MAEERLRKAWRVKVVGYDHPATVYAPNAAAARANRMMDRIDRARAALAQDTQP